MSDNQSTDPVLALIAEHDRLWARGRELDDLDDADDEASRPIYDAANALHDQLRTIEPTTFAAALAQLDFAVKYDDPDMANAVADGLREMRLIELAKIDSAPVQPGQPFGPCLLAPSIDGSEWTVGEWDGEGWCSDTGSKLTPLFWALLPQLSSLPRRSEQP